MSIQGMKLTTHVHSMLKLRISDVIPLSLHGMERDFNLLGLNEHLFFYDFNQNQNVSIKFSKNPKYGFSGKSSQWESCCSLQTDWQDKSSICHSLCKCTCKCPGNKPGLLRYYKAHAPIRVV